MRIRTKLFVALSLLVAVASAHAALPPATYPVSTDATELKPIMLWGMPGRHGLSFTVENKANPAQSGIDLWQQNADGTFTNLRLVSVPGVYAHLPVFEQFPDVNDIFYVAETATGLEFGVLYGEGGGYSGWPIASYPTNLAHPRGLVVASDSDFNGGSGQDLVVLAEKDVVLLFVDDGMGRIDPAYQVIPLPAGTNGDSIAVGDVTGDGKPDILVGDRQDEKIVVLGNTTPLTGSSTFAWVQDVPVAGLRSFGVADMDRNGASRLDIVAGRQSSSGGQVVVAMNTGASSPFGPQASVDVEDEPVSIGTADLLPADSDPDVFVGCLTAAPSYGALAELSNDGAGALVVTGTYNTAAKVNNVVAVNYEFSGGLMPTIGAFTVYPMDPTGTRGLSPADQLIAGPGPAPTASATVRVLRTDGVEVVSARTVAYGSGFGVKVGSGDIDGAQTLHATDEVLTGPGRNPNLGPHVRAFRRKGIGLEAIAKVSYFAYGTLRNGVNARAGDIDGSAREEILTSPGPGAVFGPHIRGWAFDGSGLAAMARISYFAYGTLKYGAHVDAGNVDRSGPAELLTGPGPGSMFVPQVRGWTFNGSSVASNGRINFVAFGDPRDSGCVVATGDVDADGSAEIIAGRGAGPSQGSEVRGFAYDGSATRALAGFGVTPFATSYGVQVGSGDVAGPKGDGRADLACAAGPDVSADGKIKVLTYDGSTLSPASTVDGTETTAYGANVGTCALAI